jgi:hypothetical protein
MKKIIAIISMAIVALAAEARVPSPGETWNLATKTVPSLKDQVVNLQTNWHETVKAFAPLKSQFVTADQNKRYELLGSAGKTISDDLGELIALLQRINNEMIGLFSNTAKAEIQKAINTLRNGQGSFNEVLQKIPNAKNLGE